MNILITGACGFIGSHLVKALQGHTLYLIDDLSTGHKSNLNDLSYEKLYEDDYADEHILSEVFTYKIDCIVHLAAIASVHKCNEDPLNASKVNAGNVLKLILKAKEHGVRTFLFASSAAVYGDEPSLPKTEDSVVKPISLYGIDKFAAEQYVVNYSDDKFRGIACRFFNVFGPNQDPSSPYSGVLSIFTDRTINQKLTSISVFGDGEQTRDFISVFDVVNFLKYCIENQIDPGVYNVATGSSVSLNQVIDQLKIKLNKELNVDYQPARNGDIKYSAADNKKMLQTGYSLSFSFNEAFKGYLDSLNENT